MPATKTRKQFKRFDKRPSEQANKETPIGKNMAVPIVKIEHENVPVPPPPEEHRYGGAHNNFRGESTDFDAQMYEYHGKKRPSNDGYFNDDNAPYGAPQWNPDNRGQARGGNGYFGDDRAIGGNGGPWGRPYQDEYGMGSRYNYNNGDDYGEGRPIARRFDDRDDDDDDDKRHRCHRGGGMHPVLWLVIIPFFAVGVYVSVRRALTYLRERHAAQVGAPSGSGAIKYTPLRSVSDADEVRTG